MKNEKEVIKYIRDDIIRARGLLTDALECASKPNVDCQKCWEKLNIAGNYVLHAESAMRSKTIWRKMMERID